MELLLIAKFVYNNTKNISNRYILFKLKYRYYFYVLFEKNTNFYFRSKLANEIANKLKNLINICQKKLLLYLKA